MRIPLLLVPTVVLSVAIILSPSSARTSAQSIARLTAPYETGDPGQRLYVRQGCYQCHGLAGQGSILSGPPLSASRLDDTSFRRYVRNPKGAMPPYTSWALPDDDLGQIERFVRLLQAGRPYTAVPALAKVAASGARPNTANTVADGEALYRRNCAVCHGAAREGGIAPNLIKEGKNRDASAIAALILDPPEGMPSLTPDPLSKAETDAVARFVATPS
ncbi:c-type cytochrome [Sphingomonas panacis]|uniref:c-type cytochrome n=1 Tax=Sphingomonas panacis TaxID=1560345 RepID=UPI0009F4D087|nr:cytochrome c [Sphingomonas panacis]